MNKIKCISCSLEDKKNLIKIGYFNLINGYKLPFCSDVDKKSGKHYYEKGTSIKHLLDLNDFDSNLRILLFKNLTKIEQEIRSVTGYFFEESKNKKLTWRSNKAYNSRVSIDIVNRLISKISNEMQERECKCEYLRFYRINHRNYPMWIVTKAINLKTFIDLIDIAKDDVYLNICKLYSIEGESNYKRKQNLKSFLHWIRIVRNACAHNERIYCLKGNNRILETEFIKLPKSYRRTLNKQRIIDVLIYCRYFLEKEEYKRLIMEVKDLILSLKTHISDFSFNRVRASLGIKNIENLDIISNDGFDNNYDIL